MRKQASLRWSIPQEESGDVVLRFDVTERFANATKSHRLSISRQYGTSAVNLKRAALVASGGTVLQEFTTPAAVTTATLSRDFAPAATPSGQRVYLELTLQGPGNHAVANGPIDFSEVFNAAREDYIGRFQYSSGGTIYYRELREDGSLRLYINGTNYGGWSGYTWQSVNGEAYLFNASGTLFERHRLSDMATLLFQVEPQYGPAIRIPATSYFRSWAINRGLASIADDPGGDLDQDGLSNLDEFFFGTDPEHSGPAVELLPTGADLLRIRWKRRTDGMLEAIAYGLEQSPDLIVWTPHIGDHTTNTSTSPGYLDVLAEIPRQGPAAFFRAKATDR